MDTDLGKYLSVVPPKDAALKYNGPDHWVENPSAQFPSMSAIVNESQHTTGVSIPEQHQEAFDLGWRQALEQVFSQHAEATVKTELDDYFETGTSNGRRLKLQIMMLPPGNYFRIHAHPNIEFEVTLAGTLEEFRWLWRMPAQQLVGDKQLKGPGIAATSNFEHRQVQAGQCMLNEIGSIHQSFTSANGPACVILVLWSGCHANSHPSIVHNKDPRLQPKAGWEDD